ncbi:MAG TPA: C13 family peptidase [Caulobacteraceae bacterium]|nr:C13 family peptidase [Caulobacteraceae bacterium]
MRGIAGFVLALLIAACGRPSRAGDFDGWTVAVVSGDWRSGDGKPIQAFDNARTELASAFARSGFKSSEVRQYALRPLADPARPEPMVVKPIDIARNFTAAGLAGAKGCLFYVTSHGSPKGAVFGPDMTLTPYMLDRLLSEACGDKPTVAVVSACFSGVFVPGLAKPNRMVMTAAREDRSSFGCGEGDRYPFFDACVLESLPEVGDFIALSRRVKTCVARRETEQKLSPPSEPQVWVGSEAQIVLPLLRFERN